MPRRYSLKSRVEIDQLLNSGTKLSGDYFSLVWQKSDDFRYGVFIPRKLGGAVKRNRVKRLVREAIRQNREMLTTTVKMAVLSRPDVVEPEFEAINAEIKRIFELINANAR